MIRSAFLVLLGIVATMADRPAIAQDQSVKPGINDSFQNPDVDQFIGRFEIESREVYLHRDAILDACRIEPGQTVADIGAGTGLYTRLFSHVVGPNGRVIAVDIAEKFLDHIRRTSREAGLSNVETILCRPDSTELPPDSVDVAFICDTYHHFEFPLKTMTSLYRAMKRGGRVIVVDFRRVEGESTDWVLNHVRAGQDVFESEIRQCGFRKIGERPGVLKENYLVEFQRIDEPVEAKSSLVSSAGRVTDLTGAPQGPKAGGKVVFDVTAASRGTDLNAGLERAARLLNLYGAAGLKTSDVRIAVVLHGEAVAAALVDDAYAKQSGNEANPNAALLRDLRAAGVDVYVCGQSLARKGLPQRDVCEGITIATSAITAVMNRHAAGYVVLDVR